MKSHLRYKKDIRLGAQEVKLLFTLEEENKTIFTIKEAKNILKTSDDSVRSILYRLRKKHRIIEIERGKYLLAPARSGTSGEWTEDILLITPYLLNEYYVAFWSALSFHNMTEQIPHNLLIATTKRKRNLKYNGQEVLFVTISKDKFFGFDEHKINNTQINVSSKEKTIVDCLLFPHYCGGVKEVEKAIKNFQDEIRWDVILGIVKKLNKDIVRRRLGYLLNKLKIRGDICKKLKKEFKGFGWLDSSAKKKVGKYSKEWGLKVNE